MKWAKCCGQFPLAFRIYHGTTVNVQCPSCGKYANGETKRQAIQNWKNTPDVKKEHNEIKGGGNGKQ